MKQNQQMKFDVVAVKESQRGIFAWTSSAARSFHDEIIHMIWNQIVMLILLSFHKLPLELFYFSYSLVLPF